MIYDKYFENIFKNLIILEGGYNFYKEDKGGETYKGIARNFHPEWEGWKIIDKYKNKINFNTKYQQIYSEIKTGKKDKNNLRKIFKELNKLLFKDEQLNNLVKEFYHNIYWAPAKLDQIAEIYPELAKKLFTLALNTGNYKNGIKFLQKAMNYLNRNQKEFPDLKEDGVIGAKTIAAFNHLVNTGFKNDILIVIKLLQGRHYLDLMDKYPEYKEFRGWFRRVQCI